MYKAPVAIFALLLTSCSSKLESVEAEGEASSGTTISGDVIVENAQSEAADTGGSIEGGEDGDLGDETGPEVCDGIDNDGDGDVDEGLLVAFYWDEDGDGWGGTNDVGCEVPEGASLIPGDCDDTDASIHPEAIEICNGIDENCNFEVDEDVEVTFFADADGDGYGTPDDSISECVAPDGYVENDQDCNDEAATISPDSIEFCNYVDDNCDGVIDEGLQLLVYPDSDSDGFGRALEPEMVCSLSEGYASSPGDCDDTNADINPDEMEACNGADDDCNGLVDDDAVEGTLLFWSDLDGDGHGNGIGMSGCSVPAGYAATNDDCDDMDASRSPSTEEVCNGIDDNCDDEVDEGVLVTFFEDNDGDGFGTTGTLSCSMPEGTARLGGDCDDTDAAISPGASEYCNGYDEDCNGLIDDTPLDGTRWFTDADGDGFGDPIDVEVHCEAPAGFVDNNDDCDSESASVNPSAEEICNGIDDNCDGEIDTDATDAPTWYRDNDGDGFGNAMETEVTCIAPAGFVDNGDDCNDADSMISPSETEICDAIDNDCNGLINDEAIDAIAAYPDSDEDGFGATDATAVLVCEADLTAGLSTENNDCNDDNPLINPEGVERCNGLDDNCNGERDEESEDRVLVYADTDRDGFGAPGTTTLTCEVLDGWSLVDTDCNPGDATVYPGANEYCNGQDDDCDGDVDEDAIDRRTVYPDSDGDGYGRTDGGYLSCSIPEGSVETAGDCDDDDNNRSPGKTETCDGYDENCDGTVDNGASDCECTQRNYGAHSYLFCDSALQWQDARDWCDERDYTLVTINSVEEHRWILGEIRDDPAITNREHWIGLNDIDSERWSSRSGWSWVSGESYSYSGWSSGQPDNYYSWSWPYEGEDCVETNRWRERDAPGEWNDNPCDRYTRYICEARP